LKQQYFWGKKLRMNSKIIIKKPILGIAAGCFALFTTVAMLIAGRIGASGDSLTIWDLAGIRQGGAALIALPLLLYTKPWKMRPSQYLVNAIFGGAPMILLLFGGMVYAPAFHAGVFMNGTLPIAATLITCIWLREYPNLWQRIGIAIIVFGMLIIGWQTIGSVMPSQWQGHLLFIASGIWLSAWYVAIRAWHQNVMQTLCALLVLNALVYVPIWLAFLPSKIWTAPIEDLVLQIVVHSLFGAFLAIFGHSYAASTIGPMRQSAIMSGAPVLVLLFSVPLLGEKLTITGVFGALAVTLGILFVIGIHLPNKKKLTEFKTREKN
jgi:drug/metabolite transporter (DMT)-like permease